MQIKIIVIYAKKWIINFVNKYLEILLIIL